jgi:asparagine synthase (glutamine-hydrolysing)
MCGICGTIDHAGRVEPSTVEAMADLLAHRGPDESGLRPLGRGEAVLGFRRLSIIDLDGSHQPMSNEDDTVWLAFNGEIYNYRELRPELIDQGHRFKTRGDGETILHLYEEHGLDFVQHLNGMFAAAIYDTKRRRLVLVRDRLGIKPLYYAHDAARRRIVFASETKAFLAVPDLGLSLDHEALAGYMNASAVPGPATCFEQVRSLEPGHLAVFEEDGRLDLRRYWNVEFGNTRSFKLDDLLDEADELVQDAVRLRMISDVPFGLFLSGGVDSSLVGALMARHASEPVRAFAIGFGRGGEYMNELDHSETVAERYGMDYRQLIISPQDLLADLDAVTWHLDEPCGDPSTFLTLAISRFAVERVKVALSGLGGDEVFGGYRRYLASRMRSTWLKIPAPLRQGLIRPLLGTLPESRSSKLLNYIRIAKRFADSAADDRMTSWARSVSYLPDYPGGAIFGEAIADPSGARYVLDPIARHWSAIEDLADPVDQAIYIDTKTYLVDARLLLQDKMSMAVSLEARVPLLDYRLVELGATIPSRLKVKGTTLKFVLKKLAERYVPRHCLYREKKGFTAPIETWLKGPLRERLHDTLTPERVAARGVLQPDFVEWMKREFYQNGRDLAIELWQAFLMENWLRLFVDREGTGAARAVSAATDRRS